MPVPHEYQASGVGSPSGHGFPPPSSWGGLRAGMTMFVAAGDRELLSDLAAFIPAGPERERLERGDPRIEHTDYAGP